MADFSGSKQAFANQLIAASRAFLNAIEDFDALNAAFSVHGFQSGGANQFVNTDFTVNNEFLTAAFVFDAMFAIGNILSEVNTGQRNSLREVIPGGIP